jgi:hypothetical protein
MWYSIRREYICGSNIISTVENEKGFTVSMSTNIEASASVTEKRLWERRIDKYEKRDNRLTSRITRG